MRIKLRAGLHIIGMVLYFLGCSGSARAQEHSDHHHDDDHLHFSHPLVAESPTPDTKLRFDYFFASEPGEMGMADADRHTFRLEGEYAFAPWISLEVDVPYTVLSPDDAMSKSRFDNSEIALKYANFAFAERHLLLGGGISFGIPTGNEDKGIGSDHVLEIEPFLDFGYQHERVELVGFATFGFPVNGDEGTEADVELGWNLSALYHATSRLETILEFGGVQVSGGEEDGKTVVNISPGFKLQPVEDSKVLVGAGVSLPLTRDREFDVAPSLSVFYHF